MKKLILMVMTVGAITIFFSCREQKKEKPEVIEKTVEEGDEGVLEKIGKEVDQEVNEEIDETIDKIGDDH